MQPLAAQIGWTRHQVLLDAFAQQPELYAWYTAKAVEHRWSRRYLKRQIDLQLHERQGAAVTNFDLALTPTDAEQALAATKDPYIFDFLELTEDVRERELEQALIDDIQKLLLELGNGFAFLRPPTTAAHRRPRVLHRPALRSPPATPARRHRPEDRRVPGRVRVQDEPLPQRDRRAAAHRR